MSEQIVDMLVRVQGKYVPAHDYDAAMARIAALEAENARLRAALHDVDGGLFSIYVDLTNRKMFYVDRETERLRARVRAALAAGSDVREVRDVSE